jgi:hypothetical protein
MIASGPPDFLGETAPITVPCPERVARPRRFSRSTPKLTLIAERRGIYSNQVQIDRLRRALVTGECVRRPVSALAGVNSSDTDDEG